MQFLESGCSIEPLDFFSQENLAHARVSCVYSAPVKIYEWVRAARKAAELNQTQLGEILNVTKGNVSGWENDRHKPSFDQMLAISVATVQGGFPDGLASRQKEGKRFATGAIPRSLQPTPVFAGAGRSALALSWGSTMVEFTLSVKLTVAQLVRLAKAVILLLLLV